MCISSTAIGAFSAEIGHLAKNSKQSSHLGDPGDSLGLIADLQNCGVLRDY